MINRYKDFRGFPSPHPTPCCSTRTSSPETRCSPMHSLCAFPALQPVHPPHPLLSKLIDDIVYEVNCQTITVKAGADVDIGTYHPSDLSPLTHLHTGANPSSEEQTETLEDGAAQVNNVAHSFRLQPSPFDKKSYLAYIKVRLSVSFPPISPSSLSDRRVT